MTTRSVPRPKKLPPPLEADVQSRIVDALRLAGWTVLSTSARRQKAPSGVSKGVPDLLASHPSIGPCWLGIEVKRSESHAKAFSCDEQRQLAEAGLTVVCWSASGALIHAVRLANRCGADALAERSESVLLAMLEVGS